MLSKSRPARPAVALTRLQTFTRAILSGLVVMIGGGWLLRFVLCALSDDLRSGRHASALAVGQLLLFPLTFGLTWWRLRSRPGMPPPPTVAGQLLRATLMGGAAWMATRLLALFVYQGSGLLPPPATAEAIGLFAAWRAWRHFHPAPPRSPSQPRANDTVWGTLVACTSGLMVAAVVFFGTAFFTRRTPYAYAPFVVAPVTGYVVFRFVMFLDHIGTIRRPWEVAALLAVDVVGGAAEQVTSDVVGDVVGALEDN
ncbi:MAG: hypothetical protein ACJ8IK_22205 [Burkholderiaceae bacterium]